MEQEVLKDESGDVILHDDGAPQSNMIGALTTMILEHWCGTEHELADKNRIILLSMKCKSMAYYDQFHNEWMQRIYEVEDSKNLLWKQVYLAALPSKYVEYFKTQEVFKRPYE